MPKNLFCNSTFSCSVLLGNYHHFLVKWVKSFFSVLDKELRHFVLLRILIHLCQCSDMRWNKGSILKATVEYIHSLQNEQNRLSQVDMRAKAMEFENKQLHIRIQVLWNMFVSLLSNLKNRAAHFGFEPRFLNVNSFFHWLHTKHYLITVTWRLRCFFPGIRSNT